MLLSGSRTRVAQNRSMLSRRRAASSPRSIRIGSRPASASARAQKSPAHPAPTTTGLAAPARSSREGKATRRSLTARTRWSRSAMNVTMACSSISSQNLIRTCSRTRWTSDFLRALIDLRWSSIDEISWGRQPKRRTASRSPTARQPCMARPWASVWHIPEISSTKGPFECGVRILKVYPSWGCAAQGGGQRESAAAAVPARMPESHAQARLNPPQSASMSRASPHAKRPRRPDAADALTERPGSSTAKKGMPPRLTCAERSSVVPIKRNATRLAACATTRGS